MPEQLLKVLKGLPFFANVSRFVVAYSGGLDSNVLLHQMTVLGDSLGHRKVLALHVNHGLCEQAEAWAAHCRRQCDSLGVGFVGLEVDARPGPGASPEAVAREARYRAFAEFVQAGDCVLTAHHQDDQAETLLLQLLRGAGPRGLAAMPLFADFAAGWHARPLLHCGRDALRAYASTHTLAWVEDESNLDTRFSRNFLRQMIIPELKSRYPGLATTLSRSAGLCAEAALLLEDVALTDRDAVQREDGALWLSGLLKLGAVRGRNLLHHYCRELGLPTPTAQQLQCIWDEVIGASQDSEPSVKWPGGEARRYRDALYVGKPLAAHDTSRSLPWDGQTELAIPGLGQLRCESVEGQGIARAALVGRSLRIGFRQGGEVLQPVGRGGRHALKKLFQEAGVPPWQRARIPLLYADEQLLAVAGYWVAQSAACKADEEGLRLCWSVSAR